MCIDDFSPDNIGKTAFFTGHRNLASENIPFLTETVYQCLLNAYTEGYRRFFCGCALGFDTLAAFQTVRLRNVFPDVCLSMAIPCQNQSDRWSLKDRDTYKKLMDAADDLTVLSPFYYQGAMQARNRYMADRSSLCICFLKNMHGGTASTVRYALAQGNIRIINLAVSEKSGTLQMRENPWNYMYISRFAGRNAGIVRFHLLRNRKLISKHI